MTRALLERLRCPACKGTLALEEPREEGSRIASGRLRCAPCDRVAEIVNGIPRFVDPGNYGGSFGRQWKRYRTDQLDSFSGTTLSSDRFRDVTRWSPGDLEGRWVLDAGCGAGRFAEIALAAGATVAAVDLSDAVDACYENLIARYPDRLLVVQASLYDLPFPERSFDAVYCIGVIQHTPDPRRTLRAVARMVKPGGKLAVWIYEFMWKTFLGINAWKYSLRPLTRLLGHRVNHAFSMFLCTLLWPLWFPMIYAGLPGRIVLSLLPVAARPYAGKGFSPGRCFRCVVLDTLDMYSPAYDKPQRRSVVMRILEEEGFRDIERTCTGLGLKAAAGNGKA